MRLIPALLSVLALALLPSCITSEVETISPVDMNDRTIAVGQGGGTVAMALKKELRAAGWRVISIPGITVNPGGGRMFTGEAGHPARYTMEVDAHAYDRDLGMRVVYRAAVSVVDVRTGEEVVTFSGSGNEDVITGKVMGALR